MWAGAATRLLLGTRHAHDILCTAPFPGFRAWFGQDGAWRDVTEGHLFLGYRPCIVGIPGATGDGELVVGPGPPTAALGRLILRHEGSFAGCPLYGAIAADERFLPLLRRIGVRLLALRSKPADVELVPAEQRAVTALYCLPRAVAVASVEVAGGCLQFPVDLFGRVNEDRWLLSLRVGAESGRRLREAGRLRLVAPPPAMAAAVYALARNHMGDPGVATAVPSVGSWSFRLGGVRPATGMHELFELHVERADPPALGVVSLHHVHRHAVMYWESRGMEVPIVPR